LQRFGNFLDGFNLFPHHVGMVAYAHVNGFKEIGYPTSALRLRGLRKL